MAVIPKYTTGELAKQAQVSVRTIQYYAQRGLLIPIELGANDHRYYDQAALDQLKLIILLKQLGLSLTMIKQVLTSEEAPAVLDLLLVQQAAKLADQLTTTKAQLAQIEALRPTLSTLTTLSFDALHGVTQLMKQSQSLHAVHRNLLLWSGLLDLVEVGTLIFGLWRGQWWPFIISMGLVVIGAGVLSWRYFQQVAYRCPHCQQRFSPTFRQAFFARHTAKTRYLMCPHCQVKHFCVEVSR
ncbi:hypothetical protein [Lactobacillus heilongjiangensis] [Lactiplantibacillus mudanjiangensis]|uniref:MerR family transcriptional regulator n=1 Tax=Lactiplantibacillus mudanjiangensis TaxID=1296538 RepID=UPI0010140E45|nr:hypothetical protein [Lactobacillus heilongjiangensis] [Lactiplantibacillus mudanjiangensis]